jgi:cobalt-zinc-cadmium efflux system membrane fusion protein
MNKILIFALSFIIIFSSCKKSLDKTVADAIITNSEQLLLTDDQIKTAGIKSGPLLKVISPGVVYCNGIVDIPPDAKASIYVSMPGMIKEIFVLPGDKVNKGQRLVTLSHPSYISLQKQYLEVNAQLTFAESEFKRQSTLKNENATTQKLFDKAESDATGLKNQLGSLEAELKMLGIKIDNLSKGIIQSEVTLYSPFRGYVGNFTVNVGKYIRDDEEIMVILNKDHLHVELKVFEKDIMSVQPKQPVFFQLQGSSKEYKAYVKLIGEEVEPMSRTVNVHAHIEENYPEIVSGMFTTAQIHTNADSVYVLPENSIQEMNGKKYCMIENAKNTFQLKEIQTGKTHNGMTEVLNFKELHNQYPVLTGAYFLFAQYQKQKEDE